MKTLVATLCLGLFAASVAAQPKETPPAPGPARPFSLPKPKRFTLDNGLNVTLVTWGSLPKVDVSLIVRSGNVYEKADEVWLSDLAGKLIREGTPTRTAAQISDAAARMGGTLDVAVGEDTTTIGGEVLSEFAGEMVGLVADVTMNPRFPDAERARLVADLQRRLSVSRSQPDSLATEKFRAVMFKDHPYGRTFPTEAMLNGYTTARAKAFYDATFGAGRATLYVVGMFDGAAVEAAIRKAFAPWRKGAPATPPAPVSTSARAVHLIDRPGAVQSTILIGLPVVPPKNDEYVPLQVAHMLLGGSFGSRITSNIREQKGYTYSPIATLQTHPGHAFWFEQADVTTAVTGASLKEIIGEIDRLQGEAPPDQELKGVKNYMNGTFVLRNSSRGGIISQLRFLELQGLPDEWLTAYVGKVDVVTPAQVSDMTRKHLQDDRMTIVVVGDRKVVEEQLKPFGEIR